jgi:hypothetical protein
MFSKEKQPKPATEGQANQKVTTPQNSHKERRKQERKRLKN